MKGIGFLHYILLGRYILYILELSSLLISQHPYLFRFPSIFVQKGLQMFYLNVHEQGNDNKSFSLYDKDFHIYVKFRENNISFTLDHVNYSFKTVSLSFDFIIIMYFYTNMFQENQFRFNNRYFFISNKKNFSYTI